LTIELPDDLEAALKAQAQAEGVSAAGYARRVLEEALSRGAGQERPTGNRFDNLSDILLNSPFAAANRSGARQGLSASS
jgi:plasmid stability protein